MKQNKTSWTAKRGRGYKLAPARLKAALYADIQEKDHKRDWQTCFDCYLGGYLASQREKFAAIRLKVKV